MTETVSPEELRIRELEDQLKRAEERLKETHEELAEANDVVRRQDEYVTDSEALIERWIDAFDLQIGDDGKYRTSAPHIVDRFNELVGDYNKLLKDANDLREKWNAHVPAWNAFVAPKKKRAVGRPLAASDAQCAKVLRLKHNGMSLRAIMDETNLGMQTIRTIIGRKDYSDRTTMRYLEKINHKPIRDPLGRGRKRTREALLSKGIAENLAEGAALIKAAKGL
jgi:hypothetical protein